jgi:hypothetical protein
VFTRERSLLLGGELEDLREVHRLAIRTELPDLRAA